MKAVAALFFSSILLLVFSCALSSSNKTSGHSGSSVAPPKILPAAAQKKNVSDTAAKQDIEKVSTEDTLHDTASVAVELQPQVVSPPILYGVWYGKDTEGREVSCTFTEAKAGESSIFNVVICVGKINVTGNCTDWENNSCQLTLNTKEIQNIYARWLFRYDGMWLTIQTGDQLIAGLKTFRLKKK